MPLQLPQVGQPAISSSSSRRRRFSGLRAPTASNTEINRPSAPAIHTGGHRTRRDEDRRDVRPRRAISIPGTICRNWGCPPSRRSSAPAPRLTESSISSRDAASSASPRAPSRSVVDAEVLNSNGIPRLRGSPPSPPCELCRCTWPDDVHVRVAHAMNGLLKSSGSGSDRWRAANAMRRALETLLDGVGAHQRRSVVDGDLLYIKK